MKRILSLLSIAALTLSLTAPAVAGCKGGACGLKKKPFGLKVKKQAHKMAFLKKANKGKNKKKNNGCKNGVCPFKK
jgi:hypothetical protein